MTSKVHHRGINTLLEDFLRASLMGTYDDYEMKCNDYDYENDDIIESPPPSIHYLWCHFSIYIVS